MSPQRATLAEALSSAMKSIPGASEREQVAGLLARAPRFVLTDEVADAVRKTMDCVPTTIEQNLHRIRLPADPVIWLEWNGPGEAPEAPLPIKGARRPDRLGALISRHPDDPGLLVTLVAWSFPDGSVHHSYAVMIWSQPHLADLAAGARHVFGRGRDESLARMMAQAHAFVPDGLMEEMSLIAEGDQDAKLDDSVAATMRDVTSESVFLMTALLFMRTTAARQTSSDSVTEVSMSRSAAGWRKGGFRRTWRGALAWQAPRSRQGA